MVEWLALRAGSRLLLMPKAEAMELAPKQSAEADDPLASRSEGFRVPSMFDSSKVKVLFTT